MDRDDDQESRIELPDHSEVSETLSDEAQTRRDFLGLIGKWSRIVIGCALAVGGMSQASDVQAQWHNHGRSIRGGSCWVTVRPGERGTGWHNRGQGCYYWANGCRAWGNRGER
jgi:hypothetical protein